MRGTEQLPLAFTGGRAVTHKPITTPSTLDLSEHWLHGLASLLVEATTTLRQQRALHAVAGGQPLRRAAAWRRLLPQRLALFPVLVRGDQQRGPCRIRRHQVGLAAIAGIGQGRPDRVRICDGLEIGLRPFQHRVQLLDVILLLRHLGRHDDLVLRHHRLRIVALDIPGLRLHDAAVRIRDIGLGIPVRGRLRRLRFSPSLLLPRGGLFGLSCLELGLLLRGGRRRLLRQPLLARL